MFMKELDRLKHLQKSSIIKIASPLIKRLEEAIKDGYQGCVIGQYIGPPLGDYLTSQGIKWKTFSDGEFEESSIWID